MAEHTVHVEARGMESPRLEDLEDLYEALVEDGRLLGPAVSADLRESAIGMTTTVDAGDAGAAEATALDALGQALVATRRAASYVRVERRPTVAA